MKTFFILFLIGGCSQLPHNKRDQDTVSLNAALDQAQSSFLKGCVEAMKELGVPVAFPGCRDKSVLHRQELEFILYQDI